MKILGVLSRKGGAGKTTLSVNLAVLAMLAGRRTLLIDCDPQRSTAGWWQARTAHEPPVIEADPSRLGPILDAARADDVDLVILDSRPSVEADAAVLARLSDLVLIPVRPSILDIQAIGGTVGIVTAAHKPGLVVLNQTPPSRNGSEAAVVGECRAALAGYGLPIARQVIGMRSSFQHAMTAGLGVIEHDPRCRAGAETKALFTQIGEILWPSARRSRSPR